MGEIKQANFRVNEDAAAAFREFCEKNGMSQAQGFDHMVEVLELNNAKSVIPERATDIESFEMHAKAMVAAYLRNLEITQETEARIREGFKTNLEQKEKNIAILQEKIEMQAQKYQEKVEEAQQKAAEAEETRKNAEKEKAEAISHAEQLEKEAASTRAMADETRKVSDMLTGKLAEAEENLKGYKALKEQEEGRTRQLENLQHSLEKKELELAHVSERNVELVKKAEEDAERIKGQENTIKDLTGQVNTLKQDSISQAKDYERKISETQKDLELAREQALIRQEREFSGQISALKEEKAALSARVEMLKTQLENLRSMDSENQNH